MCIRDRHGSDSPTSAPLTTSSLPTHGRPRVPGRVRAKVPMAGDWHISARCRQQATHLEYILGLPVGVVVAPTLQVPELGRFVGGGMTDDIARADGEVTLQGTQQGQDCTDLGWSVEDLLIGPVRAVAVGALDNLDTDRLVVQADRVPAPDARRNDLPHVPVLGLSLIHISEPTRP